MSEKKHVGKELQEASEKCFKEIIGNSANYCYSLFTL